MKSSIAAVFALGLLASATSSAALIDGVEPGGFTMDLAAAKAYAAEKNLPILLDFSGSDWCGWCKLMDEQVFSKAEWKSYASNNVVMVLLDFPQDKSLVPEKYAERNATLAAEYGVQGYPTFIVLDSDGETVLGRLSAGRDKTPASFRTEVENLRQSSASAIAAFAASLKPEDKAKFESLNTQLAEKREALKAAETELAAAQEKTDELGGKITTLETELKEFRIAQAGPAKLKEYQALKTQQETKEKELREWLASGPEKNDENMKKFEAMRKELTELTSKIDAF